MTSNAKGANENSVEADAAGATLLDSRGDGRLEDTPAILTPNLEADQKLPGAMTFCSWRTGWRSLLLRGYTDPGTVEEFTTAATADQLIALVTSDGCRLESLRGRSWLSAQLEAGSIGMTPIGQTETLRWRDGPPVSHFQLQLSETTLRNAAEDLWDRDKAVEVPFLFHTKDVLIERLIFDLRDASAAGQPDLYAETAAVFLSVHLLRRYAGLAPLASPSRERTRLRLVDDYMRANLSEPISLDSLARVAGLSRFHLLRSYKRAYGETPIRRLTRLRMEKARRLLREPERSVIQIALSCGYDNPTNFSSAFRRLTGVTPTQYRN